MMMSHRLTRAGIVIETLLFLIALGLAGEGLSIGAATFKLVNAGQSTDGVINDVNRNGFSFLVQFNAVGNGERIFEQTGLAWGRHTGDEVPVIFDPADPSSAV